MKSKFIIILICTCITITLVACAKSQPIDNPVYDTKCSNNSEEPSRIPLSEQSNPNNYETEEKPVIYLYPEKKTEVDVSLELSDGKLTCTYPQSSSGDWHVVAKPDGTLIDNNKHKYGYIFWEAERNVEDTKWNFDKGYCISGDKTITFLEKVLYSIGLNAKEREDFITYWAPKMQKNPYNVISFQTDEYTDYAKLSIDPKPDTLIRVFMVWYPSSDKIDIKPQELKTFERKGFTVVEWGGTETMNPVLTNLTTDTSLTPNTIINPVTGETTSVNGHPFTDKNGETIVFTDSQWNTLVSVWAYTGQAEEMISHHTVAELKTVLAYKGL